MTFYLRKNRLVKRNYKWKKLKNRLNVVILAFFVMC